MHPEYQKQKRLIYLAGFMGSGKSTIGPILANSLGFEFTDIDKLIEARAGKSISDIFSEQGERGFRTLEREALEEISGSSDRVIALGGGTIANEENFGLIHANGIVIYLQLPSEEVLRRMKHKTDRPILKDTQGNRLEEGILRQRIEHLLLHREQFYRRADIVIATEKQKVGRTVDEIVRRLRRLITF